MNVYRPKDRSILRLRGPDGRQFLNKLVSQDIHLLEQKNCLYSLLLNAQGRYLHDFFVIAQGNDILIDVAQTKAADLLKRLSLYKMRSDIELAIDPEMDVTVVLHQDIQGSDNTVVCPDPRHSQMGLRVYGSFNQPCQELSDEAFEDHRLSLGIPEADKDLIFEKTIPLEAGLDDLNAISFTKGCYLGQELTTRTKHQGLVRKRLLPVTLDGPSLSPQDAVFLGDKKVGSMLSSSQTKGIALIRLEVFTSEDKNIELTSNNTKITPHILNWHQI